MNNYKRIDWKEYALRLAHVAKLRSEDPYMQVGAVALAENNRVIGAAYNGLAPGVDAPEGFWDNRDERRKYMIHAETNLLSLCKQGEPKLVAVTLLPCSSCAQALATYGVKEVVYSQEYVVDDAAHKIFDFYKIKLTKLEIN